MASEGEMAAGRPAGPAALVSHADISIVTDTGHDVAAVEVHEGPAGATLQVATSDSAWLVVAARPPCTVETADGLIKLGAGDVFVLPPGTAALLYGPGRGEWLALRISALRGTQLSRELGGAPPQLVYGECLELARLALDLLEASRDDSAFAPQLRTGLANRLVRSLACFIRSNALDHLGLCPGGTRSQTERALAWFLRMRFAEHHGDGADALLDSALMGAPEMREALRRAFPSFIAGTSGIGRGVPAAGVPRLRVAAVAEPL